MKTLAVIPCYNEALTIGRVVLKARKHIGEVLVVDDGSSDATVEMVQRWAGMIYEHYYPY